MARRDALASVAAGANAQRRRRVRPSRQAQHKRSRHARRALVRRSVQRAAAAHDAVPQEQRQRRAATATGSGEGRGVARASGLHLRQRRPPNSVVAGPAPLTDCIQSTLEPAAAPAAAAPAAATAPTAPAPAAAPAFKRPQIKRKPDPSAAPAAAPAAAAPPPPRVAAAGGLLGSILQSVRKLDEGRSKAGITDAGVKIAEERAAETRRAFEADAEKLIREHVVEPSDEDASFDFAPSERPWRDVIHEVAAAMGLYTETNGEEGERFVTVYKRAPVGAAAQLSAAELKELARTAASAKALKVNLSDRPPPPTALQQVGVVKLNTVKRDLRGVVAVQQEMRAKKEPRLE